MVSHTSMMVMAPSSKFSLSRRFMVSTKRLKSRKKTRRNLKKAALLTLVDSEMS